MNYYAAKFAREQKENPTRWIIVGEWNNCSLVYLGA